MSSSSNTNIINPKPCNYGCNTRIYWNTSENAYFEVFSGNRHQCPNRQQQGKKSNTVTQMTTKPNYYKKSYYATQYQQSKPKMSNSLELLQGPITDIQRKYEILSDIVSEANGKVHGSQSHIVNANVISLIVYYEVPEGQRDAIKQKFNSFIINLMVNYSHQQKYNDEKHL
jgi:hypothetical protein